MALIFCPEREAAGLTAHGDCRHCQRKIDRYLDDSHLGSLDYDRPLDLEGWNDNPMSEARPQPGVWRPRPAQRRPRLRRDLAAG